MLSIACALVFAASLVESSQCDVLCSTGGDARVPSVAADAIFLLFLSRVSPGVVPSLVVSWQMLLRVLHQMRLRVTIVGEHF